MYGLEKGINQLATDEMNPKIRSSAITLLNGIIDDLNSGIQIWEDFSKSGKSGANPGAYGGWAGFAIEKKLFELDLQARDKAREASAGKSSLDDPLIVLAYKKLEDEDTAAEQSAKAIEELKNRIEKIYDLISCIKTTKPQKTSSSTSTVKSAAPKSSGKKPTAGKKTANKVKKKAKTVSSSKKKAKVKKSAGKKAGAKKSAGKKTSTKKATKKKAAKKKVSTKKAKRR